MTDVMK